MKTSSLPIVSVIVPTYNRSQLLDYTLQSIAAQTVRREEVEVLVVDDGSTDNTRDIVDQYRSVLSVSYFFQEDLGYRPGSARNIGIAHAKGSIVLFVDSGVLLGSNCIREHLHTHRSHRDPVVVLGYVYGFDQDNGNEEALQQVIDCAQPDKTMALLKAESRLLDLREPIYQRHHDNVGDLPAPWACFWTCNLSVRKSSLDEAGPFDPAYDFNWGVEDLELGYRMHQRRVKYVLNRNADSIHYPHFKDEADKYRQEMHNKRYFHQKYNTYLTELFLTSTCIELNDKALLLLNSQVGVE
jgi:glycosyltransferase involved in cell wall biosynthesis